MIQDTILLFSITCIIMIILIIYLIKIICGSANILGKIIVNTLWWVFNGGSWNNFLFSKCSHSFSALSVMLMAIIAGLLTSIALKLLFF